MRRTIGGVRWRVWEGRGKEGEGKDKGRIREER